MMPPATAARIEPASPVTQIRATERPASHKSGRQATMVTGKNP